METRAPYALIGLFIVAAIVGAFGFVYWLHNAAGLQDRTIYRVRFENSVSGLLSGAPVLFNGIRVGEVRDLQLNTENPRQVLATIAVATGTPVRGDTQVGLEFQGLTGVPVIALQGGTSASSARAAPHGEVPVLVADPAAGQSMTQAARDALKRVDGILADNAEPLRSTITNLNTFSGALARNSDRLDGIMAGLERMTGGGAAPPPKVSYDLTAPRTFPPFDKTPHAQLVVAEPTAVIMLDTQRILVRGNGGEAPSFDNAQWSDSVPKLFQERIIQSFENASFLRTVARPMEGIAADYRLLIDIRNFQIVISAAPVADVEFSAKLLGDNGRIIDARIFHATAPTNAKNAPEAAAALDEAFGKVAGELVIWASGML
jgi:phospholipid/cholesterol/gamma-HCH transport system substrate-binding protein